MRKYLNTILLLVAILLLAYIAFLKPQPQRFIKTTRFGLLIDTTTGSLCDARTPSKEALKLAQLELEKIKALPLGYMLEEVPHPPRTRESALQTAMDNLYNLLHPSKRYPLCSEI